ncbi:hypothetical protein [Chondrinema litorale]|uniref:hypothetical protein n=1 Tax=Chondrinema litorale TaxID=2994555 RepID=UPI002543C1C7|nr:hypothetical protein [Chondrinema litorale]UZR97001.1 hypothetical protein OQ292_23160 [Chondrinema litorale]
MMNRYFYIIILLLNLISCHSSNNRSPNLENDEVTSNIQDTVDYREGLSRRERMAADSDPITEESRKKAKEDLLFSNDLRRYISKNTRYPVERIEDGIEGAVMFNVRFLADSSVSIGILESLGKEFEEETKRVVQEAWKASYRKNKVNYRNGDISLFLYA